MTSVNSNLNKYTGIVEGWICKECNNDNNPNSIICEKCGTQRSQVRRTISANKKISNNNLKNFPSVSNLVSKIEGSSKGTRSNMRKGWIKKANEKANMVSPFDLPESPLYSINYSSLKNINTTRKNVKKPKYTFPYLLAKRQRGLNVTKINRNVVRLQQLKNYIETTKNPRGKKAAKNEYNRITSEHKYNITRNLR
jgi:ribosomal protein L40E